MQFIGKEITSVSLKSLKAVGLGQVESIHPPQYQDIKANLHRSA